MSAPLDVLHTQRLYAAAGLYDGNLDGLWGPRTAAAAKEWEGQTAEIQQLCGAVDARSERLIPCLLPAVQRLARQHLLALAASPWAAAEGLSAAIVSATRSYAEQDALFRQGRSAPGLKVTNARGGQSWHNFGLAYDIGLFLAGVYIRGGADAQRTYSAAAALMPTGLEWGGVWSKPDLPHYQLRVGMPVKNLKNLFERGTLAPALEKRGV